MWGEVLAAALNFWLLGQSKAGAFVPSPGACAEARVTTMLVGTGTASDRNCGCLLLCAGII